MLNLTEKIYLSALPDCVTDAELLVLLGPDTNENARYGKVKRALAGGELIQLRRGLYILAPRYQRRPVNLFEIAQRIYGPSYVSFESALSHHGWIPEAVRTITCATSKRARIFDTPIGIFSYSTLPVQSLYVGVERITMENSTHFMASPVRALLDYIYHYKRDWLSSQPLRESLRIEEEHIEMLLNEARSPAVVELESYYRSTRISHFLRGLRKE